MKKLRLFVLLCIIMLVLLVMAGHASAETAFAYDKEAQILNILL